MATAFGIVTKRRTRAAALATGIAYAIVHAAGGAAFAGCKPSHPRPKIVLNDMGACGFDPQTMSFRGEPVEQAKCLMRAMDATRNLAPPVDSLPSALANRVGQDSGLPAREALSTFLSKQDLEWEFAYFLWQPVSRANDNDPSAPMARYFVIHDTSGPNYGHRAFPVDVDVNPKINNLGNFKCEDGWGRAHVVISRSGGMLVSHDYGIPWRETKFERAVNFNGALKGLFVHNELIQPRRAASGHGRYNDAQTPDPGFTAAQYDRLALLYTVASVRAGRWLIPAFHAAIDAGIPNGHDDPLNFNIASFADSLQRLIDQLDGAASAMASPAADQTAPTAVQAKDAVAEPVAAATAQPKPADALDAPAAATTLETKPPVEQSAEDAPPANSVAPAASETDKQATARVETTAQPTSQATPETTTETKAEPAAETKPATKAETKAEPAAETRPETRIETKAEPASDAKPETNSETQAAPKSETKSEAAKEIEREAKREAKRQAGKEAEKQASRERRARSAGHCETHRHRRHGCDDDAAERHPRGKRTRLARTADHRVSHKADGARHRG